MIRRRTLTAPAARALRAKTTGDDSGSGLCLGYFQVHVPLDVGVFLCIINLYIFVLILLFRRLHNLDVEVAASGFTRDMSESFDEVKTCEDTFIANREGREEMTHPPQVSYCHTFFLILILSHESGWSFAC